jgi:hypothetical protein
MTVLSSSHRRCVRLVGQGFARTLTRNDQLLQPLVPRSTARNPQVQASREHGDRDGIEQRPENLQGQAARTGRDAAIASRR